MLTRENLEIAKLAAKGDVNGTHCVRVTATETVVTDGKQLVEVTIPADDPDVFPASPGITPTVDYEPFLLPAEAALRIAKALQPAGKKAPVLNRVAVAAESDAQTTVLAITDLETVQTFAIPKPPGGFPEYRQIIPPAGEGLAIALNVDQLIALLEQVRAFLGRSGKAPVAVFRVSRPDRVVRIDAENSQQQKLLALLVPYRQ